MVKFPYIIGNYAIELGTHKQKDEEPIAVYQIINIHSSVMEAETSSLPRALIMVKSSNFALQKLLSSDEPEDILLAESVIDAGEAGVEHPEMENDPEHT